MTVEAVDVNLALMNAGPRPVGRQRRPQPSFSRLWWHAAALTPDDWNSGRHWYENAAADIGERADDYGVPFLLAVAAAAALTPGLRWERTLRVLDLVLRAYQRGDRDVPRTGDATFGFAPREKAWAILMSGDTSLCAGPKVEPFAAALAGDGNAVVVDRHLVRLATGADLRQIHVAAMLRIVASVRVIAWARNEAPSTVQAALWSAQPR